MDYLPINNYTNLVLLFLHLEIYISILHPSSPNCVLMEKKLFQILNTCLLANGGANIYYCSIAEIKEFISGEFNSLKRAV